MVHQVYCDEGACHDAVIDQINSGYCVLGARGSIEICNADCTSCHYGFECHREVAPCLREDHIFRVLAPSNESLESACEAAIARSQRCGVDYMNNCDVRSRVELPSREAYYRCVAETPCGRTPACEHSAVRGTVGTELAAVAAGICSDGETPAAYWTQLDEVEPTLDPDVVAALRTCVSETSNCWNLNACIAAWRSATRIPYRY
jgi:hypothetical protein